MDEGKGFFIILGLGLRLFHWQNSGIILPYDSLGKNLIQN